jgi:hypothetical protein
VDRGQTLSEGQLGRAWIVGKTVSEGQLGREWIGDRL